jgi:hypothetical protein
MIPAHDSPLAALAFDASGTKLATASEKVCLLWRGKPGSVVSMNPARSVHIVHSRFSVPRCTVRGCQYWLPTFEST